MPSQGTAWGIGTYGFGSYLYLAQRWCSDGGGGRADVLSKCRETLLHLTCKESRSDMHDEYVPTDT